MWNNKSTTWVEIKHITLYTDIYIFLITGLIQDLATSYAVLQYNWKFKTFCDILEPGKLDLNNSFLLKYLIKLNKWRDDKDISNMCTTWCVHFENQFTF